MDQKKKKKKDESRKLPLQHHQYHRKREMLIIVTTHVCDLERSQVSIRPLCNASSLRVALQVEEKLFVRLSILCTEEFLV